MQLTGAEIVIECLKEQGVDTVFGYHTGGTIDKLESFPGFTTALPEEIFFKNVREIGIALAGQTAPR